MSVSAAHFKEVTNGYEKRTDGLWTHTGRLNLPDGSITALMLAGNVRPAIVMIATATQSIPAGVWTQVNLAGREYDAAGMGSGNTCTIPVAGIYLLYANCYWPSTPDTGVRMLSIAGAGPSDIRMQGGFGTTNILGHVGSFGAGAVLSLNAYSGGAAGPTDLQNSRFSAVRVA